MSPDMIKDMDSMLEGTSKKEGHIFLSSSYCHLNRTAFSLHSLAKFSLAVLQHFRENFAPIFRETHWEQSFLQLGGTGLVQYLAFGWRAVCALVCVDAGRGHGSTKVPLGNARNLSSRRHLHRSKLGSIQLLEKQNKQTKLGWGGRQERNHQSINNLPKTSPIADDMFSFQWVGFFFI